MECFHLIYHGQKKSQVGLTQKRNGEFLEKYPEKSRSFFPEYLTNDRKTGII